MRNSLFRHYAAIESQFSVADAADYALLVTPTGNAQAPVHRWFHLKEAYSHELLRRLIKDLDLSERDSLTIVDPFSGSGTTAIAGLDLVRDRELASIEIAGYEANPFLYALSDAKCAGVLDPPRKYLDLVADIVAASSRPAAGMSPMPELSTFHRREYFDEPSVSALRRIRFAIDERVTSKEDTSRKLLQIALARAVDAAGSLRKDGRTLRYAPGKSHVDPIIAFAESAQLQAEDLTRKPLENARAEISHADSRSGLDTDDGWADLVVFSPPYPNNIDYTEVYKLENWMLGLIDSQEMFASARRRSLRSHGSLDWDDQYLVLDAMDPVRVRALLEPIVASIPADRYARKRRQLVLGYANDMLAVLKEASRVLKPGGRLVCVVGNSLHGLRREDQLLLAADLMIAELALLVELRVDRIDVARYPRRKRTDSRLLRESLVVCSKGQLA